RDRLGGGRGRVHRGARAAVPGRGGATAARLSGRRALTIPWQLEVGEPFEAHHSEFVAPARLADGTEAVVKVRLPDDVESEHEGDALDFWDGQGAVRLIAHDPDRRALLLERCRPGSTPWTRSSGLRKSSCSATRICTAATSSGRSRSRGSRSTRSRSSPSPPTT